MKLKTLIAMAAMMLATATTSTVQAEEKQPAFPGAEGYARYITGGRGGKICYVTSLADDGSEGTFRWAVRQTGKRIIMFKVSGTIHLTSELKIQNGDVTIAGQTAPGDGICIADFPCSIRASNVIVRYMRFRLGNKNVVLEGADGWDGFGGFDQRDLMIDHCSVSWSIDECLSVLGNKNTTVQWCISSHSLVNSGHTKGAHGYGGNWGGDHASFHHNLIAHHASRTPRLGPRPTTQLSEHMDMRNNVIYNWTGNGCYGGEGMDVNIVNNYYKPGPATGNTAVGSRIAQVGVRTNEYVRTYPDYAPALHKWGHFYVTGNTNTKYPEVTSDNWQKGFLAHLSTDCDGTNTAVTKDTIKRVEPIQFVCTTTHTASMAYMKVLDYVGCSLSRDAYDKELISDVQNGTASHTGSGLKSGLINSQNDLGNYGIGTPWPDLNSKPAPVDTDGDGMPDDYEDANGLNKNDASDGPKVADNGYTNVENYINGLVEKITTSQNAGGTEQGDKEEKPASETSAYQWESSMSATNAVVFEDGAKLQITGNTGKTLGSAKDITVEGESYKTIKLSNGAQNTFTCPAGKVATKVTFASYINIDSPNRTPYWKEVAGTTYDETTAQIMESYKDYEHPDVVTFSLKNLPSFTFTNTGEQVCFVMLIDLADATDAKGVHEESNVENTDVYTIAGTPLMRNAAPWQIDALPKGAYIIGGKVTVIK